METDNEFVETKRSLHMEIDQDDYEADELYTVNNDPDEIKIRRLEKVTGTKEVGITTEALTQEASLNYKEHLIRHGICHKLYTD